MIAGEGWDATFAVRSGKGMIYHRRRVVCFDDAGQGWVVAGDGKALREASSFSNFAGYEEADGRSVAMVPATGWYWRLPDGGDRWPVAYWVLLDDGRIEGVDISSEGPRIIDPRMFPVFEPEAGWPEEAGAAA